MTTKHASRFRRGRRILIGGALTALALGGVAIGIGTAGATPTPPPASTSATPAADTTGTDAADTAEPVTGKDTDNVQQGDQTGPDTPGRG